MPSPATLAEFVALVQRSALVPSERLDALLRALPATLSDPRQFADIAVRERLLTNFQAEQLLQGKWKGFTIGKYRVLERIGIGGMGQVYLCEHERMRRRVAVKVLPSAALNEPGTLERFEREARLAAALDHPNIVRAYDLDQEGRMHFLVMEYIDGPTLHDLVRVNGQLPVARAVHYVREAAIGLQHAFEAGLVHRDIKPANILVDRSGVVKLLDLGLARLKNDEIDQLTRQYDDNNVLGTADFVAPEQTRDSHNVDIRADIYGLGATLYFCLAGQPPFADGTPAQKLIWHQSRVPESVRKLRPDLPLGLVAVVEKMMAKQPERRFQTPAEVAHALAPWTQQPVAPPSAAELPTLSPAAATAGLPSVPIVSAAPPSVATPPSVAVPPSNNPFVGPAPANFPIYTPLPPKRPWTGGSVATVVVILTGVAFGVFGGWWLTSHRSGRPTDGPKSSIRK
ncbi:MAG: protein kinase [Gemmataceae bacterium]